MSALWLILGMAIAVYALRLAGFYLAGTAVPPAWERALGFVPVATLSALVVASLVAQPEERPLRLIAVAGAGLVARYSGRAWLCIVVGLAIYGFLRFLQTSPG